MTTRRIPTEALVELHQRLGQFPSRSAERRALIRETAQLYGVSEYTPNPSFERTSFTAFPATG